jgi:hypothetical protein
VGLKATGAHPSRKEIAIGSSVAAHIIEWNPWVCNGTNRHCKQMFGSFSHQFAISHVAMDTDSHVMFQISRIEVSIVWQW